MKCELLITNHSNYVGIEDYIKVIKKIFIKNNILLNVVTTVSEEIDLLFVIEEFVTPPKEFYKVLNNCKNKGVKLCLIHTEFIDKNKFFNIFSSKDLFFRKLIFTDLLLSLYKKNFIFSIAFYLIASLYLIYGKLFLNFNLIEIKKRIYFAMRDKAFSKVSKLFNYHICLSDNLYNCLKNNLDQKNIIYLQQYIEPSFVQKINKSSNQTLIYISGYKTEFRHNVLKKINKRNFNNFHIDNKFHIYKYQFKINKNSKFNLVYSEEFKIEKICKFYKEIFDINIEKIELYISQRKDWPYLSPMRIIRSIENSSIPVNLGTYYGSNYDKLCLNFKSIDELINNYEFHRANFIKEFPKVLIEFNRTSDRLFMDFYNKLIDKKFKIY